MSVCDGDSDLSFSRSCICFRISSPLVPALSRRDSIYSTVLVMYVPKSCRAWNRDALNMNAARNTLPTKYKAAPIANEMSLVPVHTMIIPNKARTAPVNARLNSAAQYARNRLLSRRRLLKKRVSLATFATRCTAAFWFRAAHRLAANRSHKKTTPAIPPIAVTTPARICGEKRLRSSYMPSSFYHRAA